MNLIFTLSLSVSLSSCLCHTIHYHALHGRYSSLLSGDADRPDSTERAHTRLVQNLSQPLGYRSSSCRSDCVHISLLQCHYELGYTVLFPFIPRPLTVGKVLWGPCEYFEFDNGFRLSSCAREWFDVWWEFYSLF